MYRPEGIKRYTEIKPDATMPEYEAYEIGLAAMYNALWKMAEESPTKTFTLDTNIINVYGIPEEQ